MSDLRRIGLVAEREFVEYARQPSFRNGTLITALMIVLAVAGYSVLPAIFGGADEVRLGTLPAAEPLADTVVEIADPDATDVQLTRIADAAAAERQLRDGDVDAVLVDDRTVVVLEGLDGGTADLLQQATSATELARRLDTTPLEAIAAAHVELAVQELEPIDAEQAQRRVITLIAVLMALGQVMAGAYVIASGTVEEKASRVIEVIVSKVHPRALLTGKLVGLGVVLLAQLLVFVAVGFVALAISPDLDIPQGLVASSGTILLWYLLGFAIFGALFSIAAALSARQEDMAQKMAPMMYLLFAAFGGAFYAMANPDSLLTTILTYVPFTAPAVLPARQAAGAISGWEIALAVVVTLVCATIAVRFAGRMYTAGALRTRGTSTIRRTLRSVDG